MTELPPSVQDSAPSGLCLLICFPGRRKEGSVTESLPQPFLAGPPAGQRRLAKGLTQLIAH